MADLMPAAIRRDLLAKIHIAKKQLGLSDEQYRALLMAVAKKDSSKDMSLTELNAVMGQFHKMGFVIQVDGKRQTDKDDPRLKKIWALWFALRDQRKCNGSARTLNAFIKRQTGIERMEWLKENAHFDAVLHALENMKNQAKTNGKPKRSKPTADQEF